MSELPEELTKGRYHFQLRPDDFDSKSGRKPTKSEAQRRETRRQIEDILESRELNRHLVEDFL